MEEKKLTQEELIEADAYFNVASLLGRSLLAAAFRIQHPEYVPAWQDKPVVVTGIDPAEESEEEAGPAAAAAIHSNEGNLDTQIDQLTSLYIPELYNFLKASALYDMFRLAGSQFSFDEEKLAADILTPEDKKKIAIAWVIVKRVFAVRHPDETLHIISATERDIRDVKPIPFRPMDDTDRQFIIETCALVQKDQPAETTPPIEAVLESISQMPQSDMLYLPTAKAFRNQPLISTSPAGAEITVDGKNPATKIFLKITGEDGEKIGQLSHFEMNIEAAIGQMLQQFRAIPGNEHSPIHVTPDQIYRAYACLDSGHPVTQAQREATSKAVEKLIHTPATLDITEQLKKHTDLKDKPQFKTFRKGKVIGNLVTGSHTQRFYNGRIVEDSFTIHEIPMLYSYSAMLNQIAAIEKRFLTGEGVTKRQRANIDDIDLRRYLLVEINRIKQDKEKRNAAIKKENQRRARSDQKHLVKDHTESLNFETISKGSGFNISTDKLARSLREKVYDFMQEQVAAKNIKKADYKIINRRYTGINITV